MALGKRLINTGAASAACNTESVQAFGVDDTFSSNIATYQLDGDGGVTNNVPDTTTNYNGTATSVTYSSTVSKFGSAGVFDGYNSVINANNVSALNNLTEVSISCWFNWDDSASVSNYGHMVNIGTGTISAGDYFGIAVGDDGNAFDRVLYGYFPDGSLSTGQSLTPNTWHHVVVTYSGTTIKYYYDGSLIATHTRTALSLPSSGNHITIGEYRFNNGHHFKGYLDQIRIFNKAINESDVATLYAETSSTASNTNPFNEGAGKLLYSFDYDASDAGGYYDGTPTDVTFGVGGQINYGARFNGSSSKIALPSLGSGLTGSSARSISAWVKISATPSGSLTIFNSGTAGSLQSFGFFVGTSRQIIISYYNRNWDTSETISLNTWHHIVFTYNGGAVETSSNSKIYIDGTLATLGSTTGSATGIANTTDSNHNIGVYAPTTPTAYFDGDIDQVRLFSSVLTSDQVSTLYAEQACVHTATTTDIDYQGTTAAYYKFDNSAEDEKGSYDGTETDIEYRFGRYGQAAVFNGSSSKITTSYTTNDSAFTISGWIKHTSTTFSGKYHYLAGKGYYSSSSNTNYWQLVNYSSEFPEFRIRLNASSVAATSSVAMNLNQWHHLAATVDSSGNMKIYLDGVLTGSATGAPSRGMGQGINYGVYLDGTTYFHDGQIDQIRYYPSVLDGDAIQNLYNEKPETDTSNFKTALYVGNGSTNYISNVGFQPDFVWTKVRSHSGAHWLANSIIGGTSVLTSNGANASIPRSGHIQSFEANGFILGNDGTSNSDNRTAVAWSWKAGGDAVSGTGSGVTNVSVSANTDAGFSIVKYTGGDSASDTVNHGLTDAEMIILKDLDDGSNNWRVWHKDLTANHWLYLNLTNAEADAASDGGIRNVDSNSFGFINSTSNADSVGIEGVNSVSSDYIAYVWKSISGYSSFGKYSGNANANGPEVTTGFEPSFLLIKNIDNTKNWRIFDNRRGFNLSSGNVHKHLAPDLSTEENSDTVDRVRFTSTGFKLITASASFNESGTDNFIYMAFK